MYIDPFRALALTFFASSDINEGVKNGTRTSLPLFDLGGVSNPSALSILPQILEFLASKSYVPDLLPVTPEIEWPADPASWIGSPGNPPKQPADDSFYHPALSSYENLKNGDVIAIREVGLSSFWINVDKAYQVSYRTESSLGWPQADITTVIIPKNNNGRDIISYQLWEDSASFNSAPSYQLVHGLQDPTYDLILAAGYVINSPDHEGVNSSFACPIKEGKSTLDSIRAFYNAKDQLNIPNEQIGLWGYSGGSIATGAAMELHSTYAPELNITAAAVGGYVANTTATIEAINGGIFAGFGFAGLKGLSTEYPYIANLINNNVRPLIKWRFNDVTSHDFIWDLLNFVGQNVWGYTFDASGKLIYDSGLQSILHDNTMGQHAPNFPVLVYEGVQDEIAPIAVVDDVIDFYCQQGTNVDYFRYTFQEHVSAAVFGIFEPMEFLQKAFDGYRSSPCSSHVDATRATAPKFAGASASDMVYGNWEQAGVYAALNITAPSS